MSLRERKICRDFKQIDNLIRRQRLKRLDEKMTLSHGWVIGYLYDNRDRVVLQREFEKEFNMRRSTVATVLTTMEKNGLIKRISVENDARQRQLVLTKTAEDMHLEVVRIMKDLDDTVINGISDEELEVFYKVLDKMKQNLEGSI